MIIIGTLFFEMVDKFDKVIINADAEIKDSNSE